MNSDIGSELASRVADLLMYGLEDDDIARTLKNESRPTKADFVAAIRYSLSGDSRVLIQVGGGAVRGVVEEGGVLCCVIDWDDIVVGGEPPENWREFAHLDPSLREAVERQLAGRQLELKF